MRCNVLEGDPWHPIYLEKYGIRNGYTFDPYLS
jgi:hypothetical protein